MLGIVAEGVPFIDRLEVSHPYMPIRVTSEIDVSPRAPFLGLANASIT